MQACYRCPRVQTPCRHMCAHRTHACMHRHAHASVPQVQGKSPPPIACLLKVGVWSSLRPCLSSDHPPPISSHLSGPAPPTPSEEPLGEDQGLPPLIPGPCRHRPLGTLPQGARQGQGLPRGPQPLSAVISQPGMDSTGWPPPRYVTWGLTLVCPGMSGLSRLSKALLELSGRQ